MKIGDMVVATRKTIRVGQRDNRYFGILVKNEGGTRFIEFAADQRWDSSAATFGMWRL